MKSVGQNNRERICHGMETRTYLLGINISMLRDGIFIRLVFQYRFERAPYCPQLVSWLLDVLR